MKKYFVVWNEDKSEGFITENEIDAVKTAAKDFSFGFYSKAAKAFADAYRLDEPMILEEVEL